MGNNLTVLLEDSIQTGKLRHKQIIWIYNKPLPQVLLS